ncbi:precorrin-2 C(20)-methyltransferase [Candidatus Magnetomonas plexicatena]|uniref:precorrin-2 C(20)-methyltransferase n=1 Tax=Candidatus Magnetomonas plexicatena TaxID=2552947 RepID=UPI00110288C6|nr:precorrin-2 C(20)-methyltransferase [Nitrospirales bacterium LBB_01]
MDKNVVYSLGLGPGDPELITIKAMRILEQSDVVIVPQSDELGRSVAKDIISHYVSDEKIQMYFFPMNNKKEELVKRYTELAETIKSLLDSGKTVAYVSMGDPTLFSTSNYLTDKLKNIGVAIKHIPGISSVNASSALLGISLASKGDNIGIYELSAKADVNAERIKNHSTTIFMKVHKKLNALIEAIRESAPDEAYLIQRVGLEGENTIDLLESAPDFDAAYLSLAIIKKV